MSTVGLTPVSFVVLGLIARDGPSTPYALKQAAAKGVAYFWPFPHSQLYDEPARLAAAGLLSEQREESGRRRRVYSLTPAGRKALDDWFGEPVSEPPQIRSLALLKLFFGAFASEADLASTAREQIAIHRERLRELYPAMEDRLAAQPERRHQLEAMHLGRDLDRVLLDHWQRIVGSLADDNAHD